MISPQSTTPLAPFDFHNVQWKRELAKNMVGKKLDEVRTPSLIIDRTILERNCNKLSQIPTALDTKVRVHVKTHKVRAFFHGVGFQSYSQAILFFRQSKVRVFSLKVPRAMQSLSQL